MAPPWLEAHPLVQNLLARAQRVPAGSGDLIGADGILLALDGSLEAAIAIYGSYSNSMAWNTELCVWTLVSRLWTELWPIAPCSYQAPAMPAETVVYGAPSPALAPPPSSAPIGPVRCARLPFLDVASGCYNHPRHGYSPYTGEPRSAVGCTLYLPGDERRAIWGYSGKADIRFLNAQLPGFSIRAELMPTLDCSALCTAIWVEEHLPKGTARETRRQIYVMKLTYDAFVAWVAQMLEGQRGSFKSFLTSYAGWQTMENPPAIIPDAGLPRIGEFAAAEDEEFGAEVRLWREDGARIHNEADPATYQRLMQVYFQDPIMLRRSQIEELVKTGWWRYQCGADGEVKLDAKGDPLIIRITVRKGWR